MNDHCDDILLARYLDDELGGKKLARVEAHLAQCAPCRERLEALRLQGELLRDEIQTAASAADFSGFEERVLATVHTQPPAPVFTRGWMWLREVLVHYRMVWITSLATAAVLLAVLIPLLTAGPAERPAPPPQPGTPTEAAPKSRVADSDIDNQVIIDAMEYAGQRSMVFTVSKNNTTVIWLYDFDRAEAGKNEGDEI